MKALILDYCPFERKYDWSSLIDKCPSVQFQIERIKINPTASFDEALYAADGLLLKLKNTDYDIVFCPVDLSSAPLSYSGIRLCMHLRLTIELNDRRYVPLILMGAEAELDVLKNTEYAAFLSTPNTFYIHQSEEAISAFIANEAPVLRPLTPAEWEGSLSLYPIKPESNLDSSHSLANEWGVYELDKVTVRQLNGKENKLQQQLYIKHLRALLALSDSSEVGQVPVSFNASNKKLLFIDDEWAKGWSTVLRAVFQGAEFRCVEELKQGLSRETIIEKATAEITSRPWNLILLDLRLNEQDDNDAAEPNYLFTGEELLQRIKKHNPVLPVIIFTASTKAANLRRLQSKGADGYFIKHGPSDARTPDKIVESATDLYQQIDNCLKKGELLLPYWNSIQDVIHSNIIQEKEGTQFKERIGERLKMFLGLLKKAFEQPQFDATTFYYDPKETAFLTLWSVLNEVSECYYEKVVASTVKKHPNNKDVVKEWHLVGQKEQVFIKKALLMENEVPVPTARGDLFKQDTRSKFIYSSDDGIIPVFRLSEKWEDGSQHERRLFYQIAFIIQHKKQLRDSLFAHAQRKLGKTNVNLLELKKLNQLVQQEEQRFLNTLYRINNIRNHLYLTHGEDASTTDFGKTLRTLGTTVRYADIKDLFDLVYFLLTAKIKQQ